MAFLGRPTLTLGTPSRPSPTSPGSVTFSCTIPLFFDFLERCFIKSCDDAKNAPVFQIIAEIWSTDRDDPITTFPRGQDQRLLTARFPNPLVPPTQAPFLKIFGQEILNASPVTGDPMTFSMNPVPGTTNTVPESSLNEDWGPWPVPGKPNMTSLDEVYLRATLSSLFSAWQPIHTMDSPIVTGQFYGP